MAGVSIPFIAGQWSLHLIAHLGGAAATSFNPLHCGAVVASRHDVAGGDPARSKFQSPSLRGSGRFADLIAHLGGAAEMFQSPSLRGSGRFMASWTDKPMYSPSFNPLHCGAVVASVIADTCGDAELCFNPLHCGAVVASSVEDAGEPTLSQVSIPFIAGQWSLRHEPTRAD